MPPAITRLMTRSYVTNHANLTVVDGAGDTVLASLEENFCQAVNLCHNPTSNKLYCADCNSWDNDAVSVIDGLTDSVIAEVNVGGSALELVCSAQSNKVYCANGSGCLNVIDGATDSIIARLTTGGRPFCYNSTKNKVYCARSNNNVTVIDGVADSVIATVPAGSGTSYICCNTLGDKVYCANKADNTLSVINGATDSVDATVTLRVTTPMPLLQSDRQQGLQREAGHRRVAVIDGAAIASSPPRPRAITLALSATTRPTTGSTARTRAATT